MLVHMFKRIFLFLAVNFIVILTISAICSLFNIKPYLNAYGLDYQALLVFCLIWGMGGALISLALSRKMAQWLMRVKVIDPVNARGLELKLVATVERLARNSGLACIPAVGIFSSSTLNAFATGPSKKRALVAVSSGLLKEMDEKELEAVLGHEISHIASGDMVTMTLIQGVVNAFVMFLARALAFALSSLGGRGNSRNNRSFGHFYVLTFVFELLFMVVGSMVVAFFSRLREYRADRGSASLVGKEKMIAALQKLEKGKEASLSKSMNAFMISMPSRRGLLHLFATHPPSQARIARLKHSF